MFQQLVRESQVNNDTVGTDENLFRFVPVPGHGARVLPLEPVPEPGNGAQICARAQTEGAMFRPVPVPGNRALPAPSLTGPY